MTDFEKILKNAKTLAEWNNIKDSIQYFRGNSPVVLPETLLIEKVEVEKLKTTLQERLLRLMVIRAGSMYNCLQEQGMKIVLFEILSGKHFTDKASMLRTLGALSGLRSLEEAKKRLEELGCVETEKP